MIPFDTDRTGSPDDQGTTTGIPPSQITGVVLAGGRGARMGGVDKGLQLFNGIALAQHALRRLQPQVGATLLNANRNFDEYRAFGVPVYADGVPDYAGPLAGFVSALEHCKTPYLATVPCDSPLFPTDLIARLADALVHAQADIAMVSIQEQDRRNGQWGWRKQPVFCLLRATLLPGLRDFIAQGGRKIEAWTAQQTTVAVPFDDTHAFTNTNTLEQLQALQP